MIQLVWRNIGGFANLKTEIDLILAGRKFEMLAEREITLMMRFRDELRSRAIRYVAIFKQIADRARQRFGFIAQRRVLFAVIC